MEQQHFAAMYEGEPPWDIGGPQPAFVALAKAGEIRGSVLDVGCGTGENALYFGRLGHETWGLDFVPAVIERARTKAVQRGIDVKFLVADALELDKLGRQFDTVIDSGLFHTFSDDERPRFVAGLAAVVHLGGVVYLLCFSEHEPGTEGPRRVTQAEIRAAFRTGWQVRTIQPARFKTVATPGSPTFSPGGPKAWLATIERWGTTDEEVSG